MKLIKYQEEEKGYDFKIILAVIVFIVGTVLSVIIPLIALMYVIKIYNIITLFLVFTLILFLIGRTITITFKLAPESKNEAYYRQQAEIERLKELETTCGEYHRLKNKYKGVKIG